MKKDSRFRVVRILGMLVLAGAGWQVQARVDFCDSPLCDLVASGTLSDLKWPDITDYRTRLKRFYLTSNYALVWTKDGAATDRARAMIGLLEEAEHKGLDPEDYDGSRWAERLAHPDPVRFDLALTVCLMRYLGDLHFGRSNPDFFHSDLQYEPLDVGGIIRDKLLPALDVNAAASELEPPFENYKRTEKALNEYLALCGEPEQTLPQIKVAIEPGGAYPLLGPLADRLRQLGDLPPSVALPAKSTRYRGALVVAVKHFQLRHGLSVNGLIDNATIEQLNVPLARRVIQMRLALDRWRALPHRFSRPPIIVNIPEFSLRALDSELHTKLEMKVVVGTAYKHETPIFNAAMTHVTFRPYWNVPRSILEDEMGPKLAKDRTYLSAFRYEVVDGDDQVVPTGKEVSDKVLSGLRAGRFRVRQKPGPDNALGLIRFGIPNEHNVYLHATPGRVLFSKLRRDFSHGCIRVERPVQLAQWVLGDMPEWKVERIRAAMNGKKTLQVDLNSPIPVLIVYATAVVVGDNEVRFFRDLYGQDALLEQRLAGAYPHRNI